MGRVFSASDDHSGCGSPASVIGYSFWQSEFAQDPAITSRTVRPDGHFFPIIGVTAPEFFGVEIGHRFEVAIPLCSDPMFWEPGKNRIPSRTAWWLSIMRRLKPGWSVARANAQIQAVYPAIMRESLPEEYRSDMAKGFLANKLTVTEGATGTAPSGPTFLAAYFATSIANHSRNPQTPQKSYIGSRSEVAMLFLPTFAQTATSPQTEVVEYTPNDSYETRCMACGCPPSARFRLSS